MWKEEREKEGSETKNDLRGGKDTKREVSIIYRREIYVQTEVKKNEEHVKLVMDAE